MVVRDQKYKVIDFKGGGFKVRSERLRRRPRRATSRSINFAKIGSNSSAAAELNCLVEFDCGFLFSYVQYTLAKLFFKFLI